ncbi:MAG TPA: DUF58 domain-containing protein [Chiayiivirga sp.]|nr:DUF58 domain-containing protein [Chiayiivirga sp.]
MTVTLIDPTLRAHLKDLRLRARFAFGQQGIGAHRSHNRGAGLEFSQYRAYEPGDDLRQIDWKLYARSDRFFVREAERESPLTVWLLVDASASMAQADRARPEFQRLDAAKTLAACVAELALQQGDRFGLMCLAAAGVQCLPAAGGVRQRDRLWLELNGLAATGPAIDDQHMDPIWQRIGRGDLVVLISDGFDESIVTLAERLAAAQRELIFIQIIGADERDFPFQRGCRFVDPETGEECAGEAVAMRADYLRRFEQSLQDLDARLDLAGIVHVRHALDEPIMRPLQRLFARRTVA